MKELFLLKKSKAQVTMVDLLVVSVILIILFSVSIAMWNSSMIRIFEKEKREDLEALALSLSDQLIKTLGLPEDWEKVTEYATDPFTAGLWHLNEGYGQFANDSSYFGNNGTLGYTTATESYDPEWNSSCKFVNCLSYKGSGYLQFVKVPVADGSSLDIRGTITVEAWIFLNDLSGQQSIADRYRNYALWIDQGYVKFALGYDTDNKIEVQSKNKILANRWNHVAGVYDHENKEVRIYINGYLDKIDTNKQITTWTIAPNEPLYFGNGNVIGSLASPLNGKIDEIRISRIARRNFNVGDVFTLGLAYDSHILNKEKVVKFFNLNYNYAKNLLGKYDFYFQLTNTTNQIIQLNGIEAKIGTLPTNAENMIGIRRIVLLENQTVFADLKVWR